MWKEFPAWDTGHSVTRNTRKQQKSDSEPHQEEGKEGVFQIQKTVTVTHQPELQRNKCGPPAWLASDTRTQWHSSPGFFPPGWFPSQAGAVGHWVHNAQSCDQPGQRSLWAIATQTVCNNDYYFWNTVKTNIGALELFTSSVTKVLAMMSSSESEQEQCPD